MTNSETDNEPGEEVDDHNNTTLAANNDNPNHITVDKNDDTTHSVGGDLPSAFGPSSHKTIAGVELPHLLRTVDAPTDTTQDESLQDK